MNSFFASIGRKLAENFPDLPLFPRYETNPSLSGPGFSYQPITEDIVINSIKRLKPNKATGLDKISTRLLKDSVHVIAPTLTSLFNLSRQTGIFPSIWKNARVVPLYKKGDKQDPSNYRPISILPTLSKIIERAVHTQFYGYLTARLEITAGHRSLTSKFFSLFDKFCPLPVIHDRQIFYKKVTVKSLSESD